MGLLNSSLQIGRSALLSYQGALQVVGSNISGVGSPDYTRLTPQLDSLQGNSLTRGLQPGAGVALTGIQRNIDEALESRIRLAVGDQESASTQQSTLAQVEVLLDELSGAGIATGLQTFFNGFDELQNTPEDSSIRDLVIHEGVQLAASLSSLRGGMLRLGVDTDGQIDQLVTRADAAAREVARLNELVTRAEAGGSGQATGLRDQRDGLLRELSQLFDLTVREQTNGAINVYLGSEALVQGNSSRGLIAVEEIDGEFTRTSVRFADSNANVDLGGGRLAGLIVSRDRDAYGRIEALDELASAVIAEVNRLHADGQGLIGITSAIGSYEVLAADAPLNSSRAGLSFPPRHGSFFLTVSDNATGTPVSHRIDVTLATGGTETTLASLVEAVNGQVTGVTATVTSDQRLSLEADDGFTFTLGHDGQNGRADTSGALAGLGVNSFFIGENARDIAVNPTLIREPRLLAAATSFHAGDGTNAGRIAALATEPLLRLDGVSLLDFHSRIVNQAAVDAAAANENVESTSAVLSSLAAQKESISGVSLDEEAIALVRFERAFQGTSRFVSAVDQLLGELVALIG